MTITYGDMRSRATRIADERLKFRVLAGLEALREEFGDDFADHIDPAKLDMSDVQWCVVGQALRDGDRFKISNPAIATFSHMLGLDEDVDATYDTLDNTWLYVLGHEPADPTAPL